MNSKNLVKGARRLTETAEVEAKAGIHEVLISGW